MNRASIFLRLSAAVLFLTLSLSTIVVTVRVSRVLDAAEVTIEELPKALERQIREQGDVTRSAAILAIDDARRDLVRETGALRRDLRAVSTELIRTTDFHLHSIERDLAGELMITNDTLARELARTNTSLDQVASLAPSIKRSTDQLADALPMFLDCEQNASCVFNRWAGLSQSLEAAGRSFRDTAPGILAATEQTSRNIERITAGLTARQPLWKFLLNSVTSGAAVYRILK
jgi:uncharacterized protein YoxC